MFNAQCIMHNAQCRDAARRVISQAEKISRRLSRCFITQIYTDLHRFKKIILLLRFACPSGSRSVASTSWFSAFCAFCVQNSCLAATKN